MVDVLDVITSSTPRQKTAAPLVMPDWLKNLTDPSNATAAASAMGTKGWETLRNTAVGGLGGAGLGALSNVFTPPEKRRTGQDALTGGMLGAMLGGGGTAAKNYLPGVMEQGPLNAQDTAKTQAATAKSDALAARAEVGPASKVKALEDQANYQAAHAENPSAKIDPPGAPPDPTHVPTFVDLYEGIGPTHGKSLIPQTKTWKDLGSTAVGGVAGYRLGTNAATRLLTNPRDLASNKTILGQTGPGPLKPATPAAIKDSIDPVRANQLHSAVAAAEHPSAGSHAGRVLGLPSAKQTSRFTQLSPGRQRLARGAGTALSLLGMYGSNYVKNHLFPGQ